MSGARTADKRRSPGRPAGGSDEIVSAVLHAAIDALLERGYARLSVEEIARAVGVNKTSIYRRWPTKSALVIAAVVASREREAPFVATGDLRADLVTLLRIKARRLSTPRGRAIARALMSVDDDEMAATLRAQRFGLSTSVIQAAIDRGELSAEVDPGFVSEILLAPIVHRLVILGEPVAGPFVERVVDLALAGLPRGAAAGRRRPAT